VAESLDLQGRWWLPGHDEHKVPGHLTWDPIAGGELQLLGHLRPDEWKNNVRPDGSVQTVSNRRVQARDDHNYPIIHGQSGSKAYTLLDNFSTKRSQNVLADRAKESVYVNRILEATTWFTDLADPGFDRAVVELRHLTAWVGQNGINVTYPDATDAENDVFAVVNAERVPRLDARHDDGTVSLTQRLRVTGDHLHAVGLEQRCDVSFAYPEARSLAYLSEVASNVQDLVTIALGKPANFDGFRLEHPELPLRSFTGSVLGDYREQIRYYARWSNGSEDIEPVSRDKMYFRFEDIGGTQGLERWLQVAADYRSELSRAMATRYNKAMYVEDRIMNICAVLESFDIVRRGGKANYIDRVKECIRFAGEPFTALIGNNVNAWADTVKDLRHDLAHHRDKFRQNTANVTLLLSEQLFWLFALCILRLSDAPEAVFQAIAKHPQIRWIASEAERDES